MGIADFTRGTVIAGGYELTAPDGSPAGARQFTPKVAVLPVRTLTTGEKDTGFNLPANGVVLDVFVDISTAESTSGTKTIDVGLLASESGGDTDGFIDGASTAAAGTVRGAPTLTAGGNETYFASTTRGVLMASITAGADVAGDVGTYYEKPHLLNGTARSVVYQLGAAHTELVAAIVIVYLDLDPYYA